MVLALDTETFLFGPERLAPPVVCASFADGGGSLVLGNGDSSLKRFLDAALQGEIVGHRVAYDLAAIRTTWPDTTVPIFAALAEGRVHDTLLREKLFQLGTVGELDGQEYNLAAVAWRRLGAVVDGKTGPDIWRTRFAELDGRKSADYPPEAYAYAAKDAAITHEVYQDQESRADLFKVEGFHVRAAFCLYLMSCRGLLVDAERKAALEAEVDRELDPSLLSELFAPLPGVSTSYTRGETAACAHCGRTKKAHPQGACQPFALLTPDGKVNKSRALQPLIREVCEADGRPVPMTEPSSKFPQGQVSCDSATIDALKHLHPALERYAYRQDRIKLKTDYFPSLEWPRGSGVCAKVVHPNFDPLKKTGRVSSSGNRKGKEAAYPSVHIQAADPRVREVFRPRPGFVYAVADFTAIDLCSLAQTIKDLFGQSTHLDQLNAGYELHALLGAVLAADDDPRFREAIQGKTDREAYDFFHAGTADWACGCGPKAKDKGSWFKHWRTYAKVFGLSCPGGCGLGTLVAIANGYGLKITEDEARRQRNRWFQVYPEMRRYLHGWVEAQGGTYTSPLGMVRAGCSYTELANGRALQTPAAEGFKQALWLVTRACYDPSQGDILLGSYPVVNMHDELVVEVPEDGREAERAERMSELMVQGMKLVLPDVPVKAEPLLTRRWTKAAKAVRGEDGRLKVWG